MGGFYYTGTDSNWRLVRSSIQANQAFITLIEALNSSEYINFHKVNAILEALKHWGKLFYRAKLVVNTDNINAFYGLQSQRLRGNVNQTLREVLSIAAQNDLIIKPKWLSSKENALADVLSRSDFTLITNICPHWQTPFNLT